MDKPRETTDNNDPDEEKRPANKDIGSWLTEDEEDELRLLEGKAGITHVELAKKSKLLTMASMRRSCAEGKKYTPEDKKILNANNRLLEINYTSDIENFKKE